jgi:diamine N-acetyltransferase
MAVTFRALTKDNFRECVGLRVRDDQPFVASNVYSIAQSKVEPEFVPLAVYSDETMVGFILFKIDREARELYLCRFMMDQRFQGKGYGLATLAMLKEMALSEQGVDAMTLSTAPENARGIRIYTRFGFVDTGAIDHGEKVFRLDLLGAR